MAEVKIEDIAEWWNRRPCNIRHGLSNPGSIAWSEEVTWRKYFVEPHIPRFAQFERWSGKNVLEIGCGIGTDTLSFTNAMAYVSAIDISQASVDLACSRFDSKPKQLEQYFPIISCADAEKWLPVCDGGFDLIYSFGVLHHTPHPQRVLKLARQRISSDGELRIMLYAKWSLKFLLEEQPEAQPDCPLAMTYSVRDAREMVESCGFKVESIEKTYIFPWRVKDYIEHRYVERWPYRLMPDRFFHWLEGKLGHHLLIVARPA